MPAGHILAVACTRLPFSKDFQISQDLHLFINTICIIPKSYVQNHKYLSRVYSRKQGHVNNFSEKGQERAKYLKIWAKMYKIGKSFEKGQPHACDC